MVCLFSTLALVVAAEVAQTDLHRARTKKPRQEFRGHGFEAMAATLNGHVERLFPLTKACEDWSLPDLHSFQEKVWEARHPALEAIYQQTQDNRRLRVKTLDDLRAVFEATRERVMGNKTLERIARDAHCHESVMWLIHHVPTVKQAELVEGVPAPLLPKATSEEKKSCAKASGNHAEVCALAEEKDTCAWCHNNQKDDFILPNASNAEFVGPDDGNPHDWDRLRRCDEDYKDKSCGLCEGIGGIAWTDKNSDIYIPKCEIVANASDVDMSTVGKPIFPKQYTVKFWEILIGRMTDPFCFSFFPENNSSGTMCYRAEEGTNYYDIEKEAAVFIYDKVKLPKAPFSLLPNISSKVYHVQDKMWIVNNLWGVEQCICTDPGKSIPTKCYPSRYDFASKATYLGREKLAVEYMWKDMVVDHWNTWAHHIWTDPVTKNIVRMWKPWNGLQIFPPEAWKPSVADPSVFDVPPPQCKKGGAKVRITCDDDGAYHPKMNEGMEHLSQHLDAMTKHASEKQILV
jgi:hypothetical protein